MTEANRPLYHAKLTQVLHSSGRKPPLFRSFRYIHIIVFYHENHHLATSVSPLTILYNVFSIFASKIIKKSKVFEKDNLTDLSFSRRKNALITAEMSGKRSKTGHFPYIKQNSIAEIVSTMESFLVRVTGLEQQHKIQQAE